MNRNSTGVTLLDRNGKVFYEFNNARSDTHVSLDQIAPAAKEALIAAEDKDFYNHSGFSVKGIATAVYENIKPGGLDSGGSTLTQQLVKNALLSDERSFLRKYQELVLSLEIERRYSKDEILEMYLNSVHFGEGAFGIEDAAKTYFNKSAKDLSLAEAGMLIGILPAPSIYSPISGNGQYAKERQAYVLDRMQQDGYITAEEEVAAYEQVLAFAPPPPEEKPIAAHFALMVKEELEKRYGVEKITRSGYKVKTSLNLDWQEKAETIVGNQISRLAYAKVSNGSMVALDPKTGEILALVGSRDWTNNVFGKVNMVTTPRQPGSSIKPIVYGTGIEEKTLTAATILHDKPTDFGGYKPNNYDFRTRGDVTVRRALANSLNIPAVEALQMTGIQDVINQAKKMGITTLTDSPEKYGLSLALGSGQARLLELTNAYATMANFGELNDPEMILEIANKNGKNIYKSKSEPKKAISAQTSYIMSSILSDNSARAEVFGGSLTLSGGRIAAVKTGTNEDYRDALTVGYTPSLAVGVWVGNNDYTPMTAVGGSAAAGPIWRQAMQDFLAGTPNEKFTKPGGIVEQQVCRGDGAVAINPGNNTYAEYFINGTLPNKKCNTTKEEPPEETKPVDPAPETEEKPEQETTTPPPDDENGNGGNNGEGEGENPTDPGEEETDPEVPTTPTPNPPVTPPGNL